MPYICTNKNKQNIYNMKTTNNNRTEKKVLIFIALIMGIFIIGASIQIISNI